MPTMVMLNISDAEHSSAQQLRRLTRQSPTLSGTKQSAAVAGTLSTKLFSLYIAIIKTKTQKSWLASIFKYILFFNCENIRDVV